MQSTNITGLAVSARPHLELTPLYNRILRVLDKMPKDYVYRKETEKLVKDRLKIVKEVMPILISRNSYFEIILYIVPDFKHFIL